MKKLHQFIFYTKRKFNKFLRKFYSFKKRIRLVMDELKNFFSTKIGFPVSLGTPDMYGKLIKVIRLTIELPNNEFLNVEIETNKFTIDNTAFDGKVSPKILITIMQKFVEIETDPTEIINILNDM